VTGRAVGGGEVDYAGPEWAAPESAERIASNPVTRRNGSDAPLKFYVHGIIEGYEYQEFRRIEAAMARHNRELTRRMAQWAS
jgi:hypothetical protein